VRAYFPAALLVALLAGSLLIASAPDLAAETWKLETWKLYVNARFGTAAEYPADRFRPGRPPDNSDGQAFTAADGAELRIFASYNVDDYTPAEHETFLRSAGSDYTDVTYRATGKSWLVLSGNRGDSIFYEKYIFAGPKHDGVIHALTVTYRRDTKAVYDPIVARMARSLRASR
jgi:hypothetical protein